MAKNIRLTPALLRKLVLQEKKKIQESLEKGEESVEDVHAVEVDAGDEADSLEKDNRLDGCFKNSREYT